MEYVESVAKTDKLKCTDCGGKISKEDDVVFKLDYKLYKPMVAVYCHRCLHHYMKEVIESQMHPHDIDDEQ